MRVAQQKADALAKRLGTGWRGVAWCNLGEHYKATYGNCEVSPRNEGTYTAVLYAHHAPYEYQSANSADPRAAVRTAIRRLQTYIMLLEGHTAGIRESLLA